MKTKSMIKVQTSVQAWWFVDPREQCPGLPGNWLLRCLYWLGGRNLLLTYLLVTRCRLLSGNWRKPRTQCRNSAWKLSHSSPSWTCPCPNSPAQRKHCQKPWRNTNRRKTSSSSCQQSGTGEFELWRDRWGFVGNLDSSFSPLTTCLSEDHFALWYVYKGSVLTGHGCAVICLDQVAKDRSVCFHSK